MATYIKNDGVENLQSSLQFLTQQNSQRKARDLETAIALNLMGKNREAEELLLSSQRGLLGSIFGKKADEWTAEGVNAGLNPQKQELIKSPLLSARQEIMKEMQDLYGDDAAGYNRNIQGLAAQMTNRDIQDNGISSLSSKTDQGMWNKTAGEFGRNLQSIRGNEAAVNEYNQVQKRNADIEEYNKNLKPVYSEKYTGNEVDQQQQLMDDTLLAMENAKSMNDKLKAYNRYLTTGKAISNHYGHTFNAQAPAIFGIGAESKGGGRGTKPEKVNIFIPGKEEPIPVMVPGGILQSSDPQAEMMKYFGKTFKRYGISDPGQFSWNYASSEDSRILDPAQKLKAEQDRMILDQAKNDQIESQIKQNTKWYEFDSTGEKRYLDELAAQGMTVSVDPVTGLKRVVPLRGAAPIIPASNDEKPKSKSSLWR